MKVVKCRKSGIEYEIRDLGVEVGMDDCLIRVRVIYV